MLAEMSFLSKGDVVGHADRPAEQALVLAQLRSHRFVDKPPAQV